MYIKHLSFNRKSPDFSKMFTLHSIEEKIRTDQIDTLAFLTPQTEDFLLIFLLFD